MFVLVGYVGAHSSTRGIAERIATRLRERGHRIELLTLDQVQDVGGYDALVLGSAIHDQAWLPHATQFVRSNIAALAARPVWLFSVGMPGALGRPLRALAMTEGPKVIASFQDAIHPRDHRLFSGVVHHDQISFLGRMIFRLMGGHYGDFRNWKEIDNWADDIARPLTVADKLRK